MDKNEEELISTPKTSTIDYSNTNVGSDAPSYKENFDKIKEDLSIIKDELEKTKKEAQEIEKNFDKLETRQDKANNFIMWMTGVVIIVFLATGVVIALDYFKYNEERYDKFIDKTVEMENRLNHKFYSKEDLKTIFEENKRNTKTLECLKYKRYFDNKCFK